MSDPCSLVPATPDCATSREPESSSEANDTLETGNVARKFILLQQCTLVVLLSALIFSLATHYTNKAPFEDSSGAGESTVAPTRIVVGMPTVAMAPMARQAAPSGPPATDWTEPPMYRWMPTCETAACQIQARWLVPMISKQANPCWETNAFFCDHTPLPHAKKSRVLQDDNAESVRKFVGQFNLDLSSMQDDGDEDVLDRILEISLQYGLGALIETARLFSLIEDPAEPFKLMVFVAEDHSEMMFYWHNITVDKRKPVYTSCLGNYGPQPGTPEHTQLVDDLMAADKEVSEVYYQTVIDPTGTFRWYPNSEQWDFDNVSREIHISAETWLAGIRKHGRAEYDASAGIITTIQYLRVAGLVLRPEKRFAMRKLIAWHLLRSLVAPKDLCLAAYNTALASATYGPDVVTSDTICKGMLKLTGNIRGHAIYLLEGSDAVPLERLLKVTLMMARIQRTMAVSRLGAAWVRSTDEDASLKSVSFPKVAVGSNTSGAIPNLFARVDELPGGFIADWLRRQRAWHGLPPILQGHLLALSVAAVDFKEVLKYFGPPYYYEDGLASYNYAVLGQLIAYALAGNFHSLFRDDNEVWDEYWNRWNTLDYNSVYCVYASKQKGYRRQPQEMVNDGFGGYISHKTKVRHIRSTRLALLAFRRLPFAQQQVLPAIRLSPTQLFQAAFCAFSCTRRLPEEETLYPANMACMVIFLHSRGLVNSSCQSAQYQANQPCYYA